MRGARGLVVPSGGGTGGGITNINVSAGTTSNNLSNLVFDNSPTVTFGLNGSTITASAAAAAGGAALQGSGVYSQNTGTIQFANSNGITFGLSTNQMTASVNSTSNVGLNTAQTNVTWTVNSGGISLDAGKYLTTAMQSNAATLSNIRFSAGTTSNLASAFTFADSNGVSFGLNAGTITATVKTDYLTTAMQSNAATISNIKISAGTSSTNLSALTFDNAGGVSFGLNGSVITGAAPAGAPSPVNFSAGTTSGNLASIKFVDSNGISFGLNSGGSSQSLTATVKTAYMGLGTAKTNVTWTANSDGLSFNAAGYAGTSTGFTGANISASMTHDSLGFAMSASVAAPGGGGATGDYFVNSPVFVNSQTMTVGQSTSHILPLIIFDPISFDFIRFIGSGSVLAASTTAATTGNIQFSCGYTKSHNFVIYSRGAGANSASLQSYYSTQVLENFSHNVSAAANSTQFSYSQRYSLPCSTGTTGFTHDYSSSVAGSLNFNSASATMLTSLKWLDFKVGTSLSAGEWWLMYGHSSTTATQNAGTTIGLRDIVTYNFLGMSQATIQIGPLGSATKNTVGVNWGMGSFTTAGGGTTASLGYTNITTSASNNMAYIQLMRTA